MPSLAQILATVGQGRGLPQRFRPFANQAANEAFLRFAPEWEGLNAIREQSANTMRQGRTQALAAGQLNSALARETARTFANAPQVPISYEGAPAVSSAAIAARNQGLTREGTMSLLATTANNAPIAAAQQVRQLTDVHADDLAKINAQRASLGGQVGAFVQGRLGSLIGDDRDARRKVNAQRRTLEQQLDLATQRDETTRRGQDISHTDRQDSIQQRREAAAQRKREADRKKKDAKSPYLPPVSQTRVVGKVKGAQKAIGTLMAHPEANKSEVEALLRAGKVDGVKYSQPEIDVGFDLYRNKGKLSQRGVRVAHRTLKIQVRGNFGVLPANRVTLPIVGSVQTGT